MRTLIRRPIGPGGRRGVTLVEMLVVVALVVLMMVILVQIFQSATGAMSASRTTQELDVTLRQVYSIIQSDLDGVTAKMTPPNDPKEKRGYFEYGENSFADAQGEDTDDYMAFTTKAPDGKFFTGRQWLGAKNSTTNQTVQPTLITSQVAEVIYFLRNGNLYRRVFLVVPERQKSAVLGYNNLTDHGWPTSIFGYAATGGSINVSWQGMNDISARPAPNATFPAAPVFNNLGDLTNRENRAFRPRFANDFTNITLGNIGGGDLVPDDNNGDGVPDYYPTLYYDGDPQTKAENGDPSWAPTRAVHEYVGYNPTGFKRISQSAPGATNLYAFPYIFPGMYSVPDLVRQGLGVTNTGNLGSIHGLSSFYDTTLKYYYPNHAPLDLGDNLPAPPTAQTWWGFPTWRETMAGADGDRAGWTDPVSFIGTQGDGGKQPLGLQPFLATASPTANSPNLLPPMLIPGTLQSAFSFDGAGSGTFVAASVSTKSTLATYKQPINPNPIYEDDLLLTGVRSFDIKVYDPQAALYNIATASAKGDVSYTNGPFSAGYLDLGYGSTGVAGNVGYGGYLLGPNQDPSPPASLVQVNVPWQASGTEPQGFGHEGRMPPLTTDFRFHPRRAFNVGNNLAAVQRLTRIWDSWSTDYVNAPDYDIHLNGYLATDPPIYPSFPAPYPSPLRGIQIQIRLGDPRGEKAKPITIRHDFTDKL